MLMQAVEGRPLDELKEMSATDMLALFGARLTPNRQKCCLLPWRVLQAALYSPIGSTADTSTDTGGDRNLA
jgi:nitrogen fixation NifU-like protein